MNPQSGESQPGAIPPRRPFFAHIFVSPVEPRLRAGWRLALQAILQLVLASCAGFGLVLGWRDLLAGDSGSFSGGLIALLEIGEFFAITLSIVIARRFLDHRSFSSLGLKPAPGALQDLAAGLAITFVMMGFVFVAESAFGWLDIKSFAWQSQSVREVMLGTGLFLLVCLLVGWNEELMSRGYHLQTLSSGLNTYWGWGLSSLLFAVLHAANPHASWIAVLGIFLAGVFLGYGFVRTGQLWLPIGLHLGWNFSEGVVFGFPVSGLSFYRLTEIAVTGPTLWTGGEFGPEAGLLLIPALAIGFLLLHLYTRRRSRS